MNPVKIKFCNGAFIEFTIDEEDLSNFLVGEEGFSRARPYLNQIWEAGYLRDCEDWNHQLLYKEMDVEIPSIGLAYTVAAENLCHEVPNALDDLEETASTSQDSKTSYHWSHNATLNLISLYKENKERFTSTTVRNEVIWRDIAIKLKENGFGSPTIRQTEDKWKNLRRKYVEAKDKMGPNCSGQSPSKCKYFAEMDEVLAKSAQINPPQLASSRRDVLIPSKSNENENPNTSTGTNGQRNKKKRNDQEKADQERRHSEILKVIKDANELFASKLDKLIEKL